jgi:hypothetical protein
MMPEILSALRESLQARLVIGGLLLILVLFIYSRYKRRRYSRPKQKRPVEKELIRVEDIIQTYTRTKSIQKTARETGYSEQKILDTLIKVGKFTTRAEAMRIRDKYK